MISLLPRWLAEVCCFVGGVVLLFGFCVLVNDAPNWWRRKHKPKVSLPPTVNVVDLEGWRLVHWLKGKEERR